MLFISDGKKTNFEVENNVREAELELRGNSIKKEPDQKSYADSQKFIEQLKNLKGE